MKGERKKGKKGWCGGRRKGTGREEGMVKGGKKKGKEGWCERGREGGRQQGGKKGMVGERE